VRRLLIVLTVMAGLGIGGDVVARNWAETQIESRARAEFPAEVSVSAHVRGFPFVPRLLLGGKVSEVDAHFEQVPAGSLTLAAVDVALNGVRVDRDVLLSERRVELVSISEGRLSIEITAATLSKAIGLPVEISGGEIRLKVTGKQSVAKAVIRGNDLVLSVAGIEKRIPIARTRLIPCAADVTVLSGRVRLSCVIHELPPALLRAAGEHLLN
jgi:hypothetical protein